VRCKHALTSFYAGTNSVLGIGRATCHQFAENGAKAIYMCDFDGSNLESHKREINAKYPDVEVHVRQFDAGNEQAVKGVVEHAISTYGRLDVFFANAGIVGQAVHFKDVEKSDFMKIMETNAARFVPSPEILRIPCLAKSLTKL
jgi:NAD(P)-dependent dehydrogenase (short-subunit alcohol dehydrogenase family)